MPPRPVALVTGSSSGIGEATVRALAARDLQVVVNSRSSTEAGRALADELGGIYVQADVADPEGATSLIEQTLSAYGRLDLLVNNAGTTQVIPHHDLAAATPEVFREIYDVNVIGTWQVSVAAVPALRESGAGHIVNVSSWAGVKPTGSSIPYAVSKAALNHLTLLLAGTLGPEVRVNAVAPGLVDTPWTADWDEIRSWWVERSPLGRSASAQDVADAILGLHDSRAVTGQVLVVDTGMGLR